MNSNAAAAINLQKYNNKNININEDNHKNNTNTTIDYCNEDKDKEDESLIEIIQLPFWIRKKVKALCSKHSSLAYIWEMLERYSSEEEYQQEQ